MDSESFRDNQPADEELERIKLFTGVSLPSIKSLLTDCQIIHLEKDEALIEAGKPEEFMYLVLSGRMRVQLQRNDDQPITILEQGESVGKFRFLINNQPPVMS